MRALRTAVVGCGKVGHLHAKALSRLPQSVFVAACSRNLQRATQFADQYNIEAYCDVEEMISKSGVEALTVCTPHPQHAGPAVKAANAGVHVLIEKPLASSLADCDAIINAGKKSGAKIGTVCQRRFYAPCRRVKQAIEDGKLGRPILGSVAMYGWRDEAYYKSDPWRGLWDAEGGGVLVNQAPHQLDLLQWYMGPIEELFGYWGNLNHPYIEVEDTAIAVLRFKSGALGNIVVSNSQNSSVVWESLCARQQRRFRGCANGRRRDVYRRNVKHHRAAHQRFVDGARGRGPAGAVAKARCRVFPEH